MGVNVGVNVGVNMSIGVSVGVDVGTNKCRQRGEKRSGEERKCKRREQI